MRQTLIWMVNFVLLLAVPAGLPAQQSAMPADSQTGSRAGDAATAPSDPELNALVRQLEQRSRVLDARQATLQEQERRLNERAQVQEQRELQLRQREQQVLEREQVLATEIPLSPSGTNVGVGAPGTESPPGTPTPRSDFREPDLFAPGLDNRSFQPGPRNDFSPGPQDTRNNFISP